MSKTSAVVRWCIIMRNEEKRHADAVLLINTLNGTSAKGQSRTPKGIGAQHERLDTEIIQVT